MAAQHLEAKVVIIGDTDVGKTSLSSYYCHGEIPASPTPTIGASFLMKRLTVKASEKAPPSPVALQIWDTAGQERFRSMAPMYYRGAVAAVIVVDVMNEESYADLESWHKALLSFATPGIKHAIAVAGNKADCSPSEPAVASLREKCRELGRVAGAEVGFHLTSAVTGQGVEELFTELATNIVRHKPSPTGDEIIRMGNERKPRKSCC
mmetsp:Transcript_5890/g.14117  ORF Transcript_5890/g.14117 Transcript_5890/m.14117 type:complete len:208 (+) Transcript_5890:189-812(+)